MENINAEYVPLCWYLIMLDCGMDLIEVINVELSELSYPWEEV